MSLYKVTLVEPTLVETPKHPRVRYIKLFLTSLIPIFVLLLLRSSNFANIEMYRTPFFEATAAALAISLLGAILNV